MVGDDYRLGKGGARNNAPASTRWVIKYNRAVTAVTAMRSARRMPIKDFEMGGVAVEWRLANASVQPIIELSD